MTLTKRHTDIANAIASLQGWCSDEDGANLYDLVGMAPNGTVVELGSWRGRSTIWLGCGVEDRGNGHVYAVDTWAGSVTEDLHAALIKDVGPDGFYQEFLQTIQRYGQAANITPIRATTLEAEQQWDGSEIGLLFIDADHRTECVLEDFEAWYPFVAPEGYIVFDDYHESWQSVMTAVDQIVASGRVTPVQRRVSQLVVTKP